MNIHDEAQSLKKEVAGLREAVESSRKSERIGKERYELSCEPNDGSDINWSSMY